MRQITVTEPTPRDEEYLLAPEDVIVSKSDAQGRITYANPVFSKISGYRYGELIRRPHAILRHPDMPKIIFKHLWDNLEAGKEVYAFVKNLCKDGRYYWVLAYVRPAYNPDGSFRNYVSTRKRAQEKAKAAMGDLYARLIEAEKTGGMEVSAEVLGAFLTAQGISSETFNAAMCALNEE